MNSYLGLKKYLSQFTDEELDQPIKLTVLEDNNWPEPLLSEPLFVSTDVHKTFVFHIPIHKLAPYDWDNAPVVCQLDGFEYRLGPNADNDMLWADARKWCESVGGELPDRQVLLQCYMNNELKGTFKRDYYWTSSDSEFPELTDSHAWYQLFTNGTQNYNGKNTKYLVRAVKRFPLDK